MSNEQCPTCRMTDARYKKNIGWAECTDPWHSDDHLRSAPPPDTAGVAWQIEHDGFKGREIGSYTTLEGKQGVVLQQIGTQVVHVYNRKWLKPCTAGVTGEPVAWQKRNANNDWAPIHDCSDESLYALDQAGWETRPLYAHLTPLERQAVERETIERCAKVVEQYGLERVNDSKEYPATVAAACIHRINSLPPLPGTEGDSTMPED